MVTRWILLSNDKPPISTLLEKYYAIRSAEFNPKPRNDAIPSVCKVFDKLPKMWSIINESILKFGSSQLMLGPKLFMSCPSDYQKSEIWFTDLWNYSIAPYVMELVRWKLENAPEASLADWKSPLQTILNTGNYPWQNNINQAKANLRDITPHDIQREPIPIKNVSDTEKSNTNNSEQDLMALLKRVMEINSPYASSDELPLESNI
ncbi:uncharacterized protein TRIADDRAFT_54590 [Trichoplax adhaerens]|uniref:CortBP2/NAV1-like AAA+ ATPase lid domain-containing protein n=1 Tax=Trichoplax adhaerens TaxID=10228 RepID=B3RSG7_TRIAD|nr:hypothetical protein TRIADDRAFT_54590 [Trichoplax adhaerens]EDV27052.1 hypothetical protein TRIADDRAFT_54590 [Trichoplax adhaerens]|eukprot:XP_002111048.1 hypothetical protein TRIADDRAFT_54590 [Trichoplax adhaerens]